MITALGVPLPLMLTVVTALGCIILKNSFLRNLKSTMKRSILAPPEVLPAHAPMNIITTSTTIATGPQSWKSGSVSPVDDSIDTAWKRGSIVTSSRVCARPLTQRLKTRAT